MEVSFLAKTKVAQRFLAGIKQWQQKTCVKFVPRGNHRDWVQIFRERNPKSRRYVWQLNKANFHCIALLFLAFLQSFSEDHPAG